MISFVRWLMPTSSKTPNEIITLTSRGADSWYTAGFSPDDGATRYERRPSINHVKRFTNLPISKKIVGGVFGFIHAGGVTLGHDRVEVTSVP